MARHHIVQNKYLAQWKKSNEGAQLNIYIISEGKCKERGPNWKGFWRNDFNVLVDDQGKSYLPEDVTALIDTQGIDVIKRIDDYAQKQLSDKDRSTLAFYIALQYIRTPRHREESDKAIQAATRHFMRKDISSPDDVGLSKEEILKEVPANKYEENMLKKIGAMSDDEVKQLIFDAVHNDDISIGLTTTGHSKSILTVDELAKELFKVQWVFLVAPKGTSFITSDNPCFTISPTKIMNGLLSPRSIALFPLRPDLCIYIKPAINIQTEIFIKLNKKEVRDFNEIILSHSYECIVAKDEAHLKRLTKDFNPKNHRKSRDVIISESGPYAMFNLE